jgi:hypothetical protein
MRPDTSSPQNLHQKGHDMNTVPRVRQLQAELNSFTGRFLEGVNPISEDGAAGPATEGRINLVKRFLGYTTPSTVTNERVQNAVRHISALAAAAVERDRRPPALATGRAPKPSVTASAQDRPTDGSGRPRQAKLRARTRLLIMATATTLAAGPPAAAHGMTAPARITIVSLNPQPEPPGIALPPGPCISLCGR